jgi:hypothetical protein
MKSKSVTTLIALIVIFLVSVLVRLPNLSVPLERHHEYITGHTLMTLSIWDEKSAKEYYYSPVYSFDNPGDKDIKVLGGGISDKDGNIYYVSYPPFSFIFPYAVFSLLQVKPDVIPLRVLNLLLHFIAALFVFFLVNDLYGKRIFDFAIPSFTAFIFYVFASGNLWFHANVYFADVLSQVFFVLLVWLYFRIYSSKAEIGVSMLVLAGVLNFFSVYTEWLGLFLAFTVSLFLLVKALKDKTYLKLFLVILITTIAALGITIWQYSSIDSFEQLWLVSKEKYLVRSGVFGSEISEHGFGFNNPESYNYLEKLYNHSYLVIFNVLGTLFILYFLLLFISKKAYPLAKELKLLLFIALPILIHHLVFFNFTVVHDFSNLKTSLFFVVLIALLIARIAAAISDKAPAYSFYLFLPIAGFLLFKAGQSAEKYLHINSVDHVKYYHYNLGNFIKEKALKDERIYLEPYFSPETMFYAHRIMQFSVNLENATLDLKNRGKVNKGIYFAKDGKVFRFNSEGEMIEENYFDELNKVLNY